MELGALVAITKLSTRLILSGRQSAEVLDSLRNSLWNDPVETPFEEHGKRREHILHRTDPSRLAGDMIQPFNVY